MRCCRWSFAQSIGLCDVMLAARRKDERTRRWKRMLSGMGAILLPVNIIIILSTRKAKLYPLNRRSISARRGSIFCHQPQTVLCTHRSQFASVSSRGAAETDCRGRCLPHRSARALMRDISVPICHELIKMMCLENRTAIEERV